MTGADLPTLAERWLALWNGDLDLLPTVAAEDIVTHAVSPDGFTLQSTRGRAALGETIRQVHACFTETTSYEVGPIIQSPYLVVRWHSTGRYRGGMPGVAAAAVGRPIDWRGIDILRVENGVVIEFWMSADISVLLRQLDAGR